ncbi:MAG: hypothetical protein ACE15F_23460 [bacterium]
MTRMGWVAVWIMGSVVLAAGQEEPPLEKVLGELGIQVTADDEIQGGGPAQGLFIKTHTPVEVLLAAKYSFAKQETVSNVRAGFFTYTGETPLHLLFECGPEAGESQNIMGLPTTPKLKHWFDPGIAPFGFYVQSANFNPAFAPDGETVYTCDAFNQRVTRFGNDLHKVKIFPYKTQYGITPNWFVLCWEFSTNNDYQDLITVVRGVRPIVSAPPAEVSLESGEETPATPEK